MLAKLGYTGMDGWVNNYFILVCEGIWLKGVIFENNVQLLGLESSYYI